MCLARGFEWLYIVKSIAIKLVLFYSNASFVFAHNYQHLIFTLSSHYPHIVIILSYHGHHLILILSSHYHHLIPTLLSPYPHIIATLSPHYHHIIPTLSSHYHLSITTLSSHYYGIIITLSSQYYQPIMAHNGDELITGVLETAVEFLGLATCRVKVALYKGSSKQGKTYLAKVVCSWVNTLCLELTKL